MQLETRSWRSDLQQRLEREMLATMEVVCGGEESLQVMPADAQFRLHLGPYHSSPLSGLHFDAPRDTASS
jgi:hypothetical protein